MACAPALLFLALAGQPGTAQERTVWEYKVLQIQSVMKNPQFFSIDVSERDLASLGKDGWELVAANVQTGTRFEKVNSGGQGVIDHNKDVVVPLVHPQSLILIFKRPVPTSHLTPQHIPIVIKK